MEKTSYTKKQRDWIRTHIYRVYQFRKFLKEEEAARKYGQKGQERRFRQKKEHVSKLLAKHMSRADIEKTFSDGQITNLNLDIRRYIDQGNKPKQIIWELLKKNK